MVGECFRKGSGENVVNFEVIFKAMDYNFKFPPTFSKFSQHSLPLLNYGAVHKRSF